jgi:hypothetical protein
MHYCVVDVVSGGGQFHYWVEHPIILDFGPKMCSGAISLLHIFSDSLLV